MTITVTPMTAYHIKKMAGAEQCSPGKVVDKLVRDRMRLLRDAMDGVGGRGTRL